MPITKRISIGIQLNNANNWRVSTALNLGFEPKKCSIKYVAIMPTLINADKTIVMHLDELLNEPIFCFPLENTATFYGQLIQDVYTLDWPQSPTITFHAKQFTGATPNAGDAFIFNAVIEFSN
jgi:hypothetical protein